MFVMAGSERIGIQCKRYADGTLKFRHIEEEVDKAEKKGARIGRLIIATTATSDARLIERVHEFSDARVSVGKFPVEVESWEDICRHIQASPRLLNDYAPNAPGAAFHRQDHQNVQLLAAVNEIRADVSNITAALPTARPESVDKLISAELDHINELLKANRYAQARDGLERIGADLAPFDRHQKARWYLQRGICTWHQKSGEAAVDDFFKAAELYPNDDKMAAARIRGLILSNDIQAAIAEGELAVERFPASPQIWLILANARLVAGDFVSRAEIPVDFEKDPDVLQIAAWARQKAGDCAAALELSQTALASPSAGFFVRLAALSICVQQALVDPVTAFHGLLTDELLEALSVSTASFEPWEDRIFSVEDSKAVEEAVAMQACGYLLLSRAEKALALIQRSRELGINSDRLLRAEIESLRALGRRDDILKLATRCLEACDDEVLLLLAEAGGNTGDVNLTDKAAAIYRRSYGGAGELADMFKALCWVARSNGTSEQQAAVVSEVRKVDLSSTDSLPLLLGGVRVLFKAGGECLELASAAAARVSTLVPLTANSSDRNSAADVLFAVQEYERAAPYYESLARLGAMSELHVRLLECYVRSGKRRKAKELLNALPSQWAADDLARELAIDLGQQAGDWSFLEPIAKVQRQLHPNRLSTWLFSLQVALGARKLQMFHELLAETPATLEGSVRQFGQLASLELAYGSARVGMDRAYRMFRERLDDIGAAEEYFMCLMSATDKLPHMEESASVASSGTSVTLEDERGASIVVTIDPQTAGELAQRDEFYPAFSPLMAPIMGAAVGAMIELSGGMGSPRKYIVKVVTTAYRRLLVVAQEKLSRSVQGPERFMQVAIPHSETEADFSQMQSILKQRSEHGSRMLQLYREHPMPLGMLGKLLGQYPLDLVIGWHADGPPLVVTPGGADLLATAKHLLSQTNTAYVVDSVTLTELVALQSESVLAILPEVFVASDTLNKVEARLQQARTDRACGYALNIGGRVQFLEHSEAHKTARIAFFERVLAAISTYCTPVPAYGPSSIPASFRELDNLLSHEEKSTLLLAAERAATLFTLDERLAGIGKAFLNLDRVWPQAVFEYATNHGHMTPESFSLASARLFVGNRWFTPMRAEDLITMCLQGGHLLVAGLDRFKRQLRDPQIDFGTIGTVCLQFISLLPEGQITIAAFREVLIHICEAAFRHPNCLREPFKAELDRVLIAQSFRIEPDHPNATLRRLHAQRRKALTQFLLGCVLEARQNAEGPEIARPLRLKVLNCTTIPLILSVGESDQSERVAPEGPKP